ncbi:gamma subclass chorismate mutase AroQ [Pseudonocardia adelaidensis]|uniref:gamma subclass chorismate mutase AroQ n=1 Tax=Pseudonocardia adelaidensis TaxID=648754 RepID=UPI0031EE1A9A
MIEDEMGRDDEMTTVSGERGGGQRPSPGTGTAGGTTTLVIAAAVLSGCGQPATSSTEVPGRSAAGLAKVVQLAAQRATVSDRVAAAKLGTGQPVTDPEREAVVVADARAQADRDGVDPEWVARVVADQIAASIQVQNDLLRQWTEHPDSRPAERPDLAQVRPEITCISNELVAALKIAEPARAQEDCSSSLAAAAQAHAGELDDIHRAALDRALQSVCDQAPS